MEKSYRINELSLNSLKRAATGGMKNLILKIEYVLTENDGNYLAEIAKQVNTQMIILQRDDRVDIYKQDSYIYLDFSDADIFYFDITDINWLRLYLGVYGLHCINARNTKDELYEKVRSIFSEQKYMPSDDSIRSVTEQFLREYFVSPEEAANRKRQRLELIYQLRREYKACADMESLITERLSATPFYATYKEDFLKYAEHYIKNTGISGITAERILKQVKADKRFSYGEIKASYTGHKKGYGFQNLSLIRPFEENIAEPDSPVQNKTVTALNTIVRELDLKEKLRLK